MVKRNPEEKLVESVEKKTQAMPTEVLDKIKTNISLIEPQARMEFLKEQFALAQKDARETNEGALNEILPLLEKVKPLFLNLKSYRGEAQMEYTKREFEKMEEVLKNYSGDMSGFMESIARNLEKYKPYSYKYEGEYIENLEGESLIKAFKYYIENNVKDFFTAQTASYVFSNATKKLQKTEVSLE